MTRAPGWHERARVLDAAGCSSPEIAAALSVSVTSVLKALNPEYAARQRVLEREAARRRYATDPANRAKRLAASAAATRQARARKRPANAD